MTGFIAPYTFTKSENTGNYSAISISTLYRSLLHPLMSSVFTSRILATGLSQSHFNFKSHVKFSWHSLISFLPFLLNHLCLPSPELYPIALGYCSILLRTPSRLLTVPFYKPSAWTPRKTPSSIFNGARLLVRYLAMNVILSHAYASRECVYRVVT
jgi:hypothetical protein